MAGITFILGGARSGKSSYAVSLAKSFSDRVVYLATGIPSDEEMRTRIENHRIARPEFWKTIEEPLNVGTVLIKIEGTTDVILLDCLSVFVSNLILHYQSEGASDTELEEKVLSRLLKTISIAREIKSKLIIVSNEVGMGVVPGTPLGRLFRDIMGRANQITAAEADEVFLLVAGLPIRLK